MGPTEYEQLLHDAEVKLARLKALYEQYFQGIEKVEPTVPRKDLDRTIERLRKEQPRNTALRFRFQMLVAKYGTYQSYWQRIARQIEEGTYRRDVIRAQQRRLREEAAGSPYEEAVPEWDIDLDPEVEPDEERAAAIALGQSEVDALSAFHAAVPGGEARSASPPPRVPEVRTGAGPAGTSPSPRSVGPPSVPSRAVPSMPPGAAASPPSVPARPAPSLPPRTAPRPPPVPALATPSLPPGAAASPPSAPARPAPPPPPPSPASPPSPAVPMPRTSPSPALGVRADASAASAPKPASPAPASGALPMAPPASRAHELLDEAKMRRIYESFIEARKRNHERTDVNFETVVQSLKQALPKLREKHGDKPIDFEVVLVEGKVALKPKIGA